MKYTFITIGAFIFWFIETAYFGWNMEAQSTLEAFCDTTVAVLFIWGIGGDILKNVEISKKISMSVHTDDVKDVIDKL